MYSEAAIQRNSWNLIVIKMSVKSLRNEFERVLF